MEWYVYIVECADGTFYTGVSTDPNRRAEDHNTGMGAKYTSGRRPVTLLYIERAKDYSEALKREFAIKKLKRYQKMNLIREGQ